MKDLNTLNGHRINASKVYGWNGDGTCGAFAFPSPIDGQALRCIASSTDGWDHVSVSRSSRCPNWPEMDFIKRKFFHDDETVVQFHVPRAEHINFAENCLHIWRLQGKEFPRPPSWMVMTK